MANLNTQKVLFYVLLFVMTAIYIGPFLFSLSISFNAEKDVFAWPIRLLPDEWTLDNYREVWEELPFVQWLTNSAIITVVQTICNVFFAAVAGFVWPFPLL